MKESILKHKKTLAVVIAAGMLLLAAIGGTLAWLTANASPRDNQLTPAHVTLEVWEGTGAGSSQHGNTVVFAPGAVKEDVKFKNTSNIDAYIRASLVPIWRNADGTGAGLPANDTYTLTLAEDANWFEQGGFYYYKQPVPAGGFTGILAETCSPKADLGPEYQGKYLEVQIVAQAIQAHGTAAATAAWGVSISDGLLAP